MAGGAAHAIDAAMSAKVAEDPAVIAALEAKAARSPRRYRLWLAVIAIAGDFALTLTLIFPVVAIILIGMYLPAPHRWPWRPVPGRSRASR